MFDTNPNLIQTGANPGASKTSYGPKPAPLILFHDGGGTIFSYYCLGDLDRPVFGIANPRYESGQPWEGGIPELAGHYLRFVKEAVPDGGDVILGGWSLGGVVSLELARQLADDAAVKEGRLRVLGIVMIDSVCPLLPTPPVPIAQHAVHWADHTREETKRRVLRSFANAVVMTDSYAPPVWEAASEGDPTRKVRLQAPPVVLLRAVEAVPLAAGAAGVAKVDVYRKEPRLGWDRYKADLITREIRIPGNHYNLFHTDEALRTTTAAIKQACEVLEGINNSKKMSFA